MKLVNIGLASALLVLTAGISGCNSDDPPPEVKPVAAAPVVAAKPVTTTSTVDTLAMQDQEAAEDAEYADDGSQVEPGAMSSYSPESERPATPKATSSTAGTAGSTGGLTSATKSASTTAATNTSTSNGTGTTSSSSDVGGSYGSNMGISNGLATSPIGITAPVAAPATPANRRSAIVGLAVPFSTHLLLAGQTAASGKGQTLTYDAYFPAGFSTASTGPYVFVVHGGDWSEGAKEDVKSYAIALAQAGFIAIAPNYRLAPANPHPAQVNDLSDMMAYIEANPNTLLTTGTSYGAVGIAAGGHLASLVALSPNSTGHLKCVANVFAQSDLTNLPALDPAIKQFLGTTYSPEMLIATSPLLQIPNRVGSPSFYLSHGTADLKVPYAQSVSFAAALNRSGLTATLKSVQDAGHGYSDAQALTAATDIAAFMTSCLSTQ